MNLHVDTNILEVHTEKFNTGDGSSRYSLTLVSTYKCIWRYNPEDRYAYVRS
jgi:hypothetical protein